MCPPSTVIHTHTHTHTSTQDVEAWAADAHDRTTLNQDTKIGPEDHLSCTAEESGQNMDVEGRLGTDRHVEYDLKTERASGSQSKGLSPRPELRVGADSSQAPNRPLSPTTPVWPQSHSPVRGTFSSDDESGGSSGGSNDQIDPGIGGVDVCDRIALGRQDVDSSGGGDGSGQGVLDSAGAMGWQCYNRSFENLPVNNFCGACSTKYTADVPHQKG